MTIRLFPARIAPVRASILAMAVADAAGLAVPFQTQAPVTRRGTRGASADTVGAEWRCGSTGRNVAIRHAPESAIGTQNAGRFQAYAAASGLAGGPVRLDAGLEPDPIRTALPHARRIRRSRRPAGLVGQTRGTERGPASGPRVGGDAQAVRADTARAGRGQQRRGCEVDRLSEPRHAHPSHQRRE